MNINTLIEEATRDELVTIAGIAARIAARPAVVVTVATGTKHRRYVVATEDEHLFAALSGMLRPASRPGACDGEVDNQFGHMGAALTAFGAQWLRRMGTVDEMYRTLSIAEVVKVERIARSKVWGR